MTIDELNQKQGIAGRLTFSEENGFPVANINNDLCRCKISIYGAQVLSFTPVNSKDLLWLSEVAAFEPGVAIRGGIPLCFPWFGPHSEHNDYPKHGFARLMYWSVERSEHLINGATRLILSLSANEYSHQYFPYEFQCKLEITAGEDLIVKWITQNTSVESFVISNALHSYFSVGDISTVQIIGLENVPYLEEIRSDDSFTGEPNPISLSKETDRTYSDTTNKCKIVDKSLNRTIVVEKGGSSSTVVWNPWAELSAKMQDLNNDDYKYFVCLEAANVLHNSIEIEPGEQHSMTIVVTEE